MIRENIKFKVAILDLYDGVTNEGMRCIKKLITSFGTDQQVECSYTIYNVRQLLEIPDMSYDAYISTGGPGNPAATGVAWERKYFKFLDKIVDFNLNRTQKTKKYLFLICHSFQMACIHWKLGLVSKRRKTSFGTFPVHKTAAGRKDLLLVGLEDPFWIVDSRDFQVTQPNKYYFDQLGAKLLCLEKIRPHVGLERAMMAIRFSKEITGTQFHPEADADGMLHYFLKEDKKDHIIKNHGAEKYNDMILHLNDPDKIMLTESKMIPNFLMEAFLKSRDNYSVSIQ
tara:strand:+ start:933 stop:1784 length:852 start_codon:yes stop_codon:yes gene_type:complete